MSKYVIHITGMVNGQPSRYDDSYVARFDFEDCEPGQCHLDTVRDRAYAQRFEDATAAWECWKQIDPRQPTRPHDGQPNRPLTVFNVGIEPVPESSIDGSHRSRGPNYLSPEARAAIDHADDDD